MSFRFKRFFGCVLLPRKISRVLRRNYGLCRALAACSLLFLAGCSSSGGSDDDPAPNAVPVFTSATTVSVDEGVGFSFYTGTATDEDGDQLTFSISGGEDAASFSITEDGQLSFVQSPVVDNPSDADGNNVFLVIIDVTDGSATASLNLAVTVSEIITNLENTAPAFTSAPSVSTDEESDDVFYTATATDEEGDELTFSIAGGEDAASFSITEDGLLSFVEPPDFEAPSDANADNDFLVTLSVTDGEDDSSLDLVVTVDDVAGVAATRVADALMGNPVFVLGSEDDTNRLFVVVRGGGIGIIDLDTNEVITAPYLDIQNSISLSGEGGLLGMAVSPDFVTTGDFYVHATNTSGDTEIRRYTQSTTDPNFSDPASEELIITIPRTAVAHHGGWLGFGPDGFLYILLGDQDQPATEENHVSQDLSNLLGSVLRIDPFGDDFPQDDSRNYAIPTDNPFVGIEGADEIYAYGLRNPFSASFDSVTGNLYIGDVGEDNVEEVNLIPPGESGQNFGWPFFEGTQATIFDGDVVQTPTLCGSIPCDEVIFTPPALQYFHGDGLLEGQSIVGGFVYRGPAPELEGRYVFSDFVTGNFWSVDANEFVQGQTIDSSSFRVENDAFRPDVGQFESILGIGQDNNQNLYILDIDFNTFLSQLFVVEPF